MYGWRKRIGLIVPSSSTNIEVVFNRLSPKGITTHVERAIMVPGGPEDIDKTMEVMNNDLPRAAKYLSHMKPDIIVWACTGATFWKGVGYNKILEDIIKKEVDILTITASTSFLEALKEMKMKKIAVASPYAGETNRRLKVFLEGNGYKVTNMKGLGLVGFACAQTYPEEAYQLAVEANTPDADGVFLSCQDFHAIEIIDVLERDLAKPVILAIQATIWYTLKNLKITDPIEGCGELLRMKR